MLRLARLRLLAGDGAGAPLPPGAAGEVGQAARTIVAETGAAGQAAVAAVAESRRSFAAVFLAARLAAAAAEDGSAAARFLQVSAPRRTRRGKVAALLRIRGEVRGSAGCWSA